MSFSAHYLLAVLLAILSLPLSLPAQTTPKQTSKTPRGSISGRITIKERGVAGVVVSLRTSDVMNMYERLPRATTDPDGFYRIPNVAPGSYDVTPVAPGFVPANEKEQRSKSVLVGEDENIESINFTLVRGGVITGRVTDADGRAVIQQQVFIYRSDAFDQQSQPQAQQRPVFAMSGAQTDDRGIYRVFGLLPGRYKVGAGRSDDIFTPGFAGAGRSVYKQVFHPDVTEPSKATLIEVGEGTEASNVDITLGRTLQTFTIAGRVVDGERGLPAPGIRLGVQRVLNQRVEFVSTFVNTNAQGDFVIEGLIPGKYGLYLYPNQSNGMRLETLTFDIIDQDLSGLSVKLIKGASVSGFVTIDTEDKTVLAKFSELQLRAYVADPTAGSGGGMSSSASSPIGPDGSFHLIGLPGGTASLNLGSMNGPFPPKGISLARVEREGVSLPRGIELREGEQLTGLRVVLTYGTATIRGVVKLENGTLPEGAKIFVRLTKTAEQVSNLAMLTADERGHFLMEGIQAGVYQIHASIGGPRPVLPPRMVKREITIQDGATTEITLTIDMSAPTKP